MVSLLHTLSVAIPNCLKKSNNFGVKVMRNHRDDIKNEIAYFYTVIKNMDTKGEIKQSKIN